MPNFLPQFKQPCPADFVLQLADLTVLTCQKVVRVVPNKRVVCQALWQGKPVYAKLFFGKNASKYAGRDAAGVKWLMEANIDTPRMLYQGEATDESAPENILNVLIFEAIIPANNVEQVWQDLNQNQNHRLALATKIVAEVAKHHNAGLLQTDLYLKNFLVSDDKIYTLDGDGIRKFAHLTSKQALQNLAVIWSKFDVLDIEKWQAILVDTYSAASTWKSDLEPVTLANMANQHRQQVAGYYADKKVFRQCADVNITAVRGLFIAASSHANINMPANIVALDALIQPHNLLKNGNTSTVALAEFDNKKIVVKRYNIKSFWHGISRAFRPSRAAVSWANAHRLTILNIATAKPIALYEQRTFGLLGFNLRSRAYFLAEYLDIPDVTEYFAQTQDKTQRAEAVKNIVTLFYKLYLLQISHGDMKATNIKMRDTQPALIDLDSMRQHRKPNIAAHVRDLQRFMQNWQNDNALYNAFVKTFKVVYPDDSMLIKAGIATNKEFI